jgi:hypothetical protein
MQAGECGYVLVPEVLTFGECDSLIDSLTVSSIARSRAGVRHLMSTDEIAKFASDRRLLEIAARCLGVGAVPFRATLFDKSSRTNWLIPWHQDTALPLSSRFDAPGWGPWSQKGGIDYSHAPAWALSQVIALRVHLDSSRADNGPLRVIPSSHLAGVLSDEDVCENVKVHDYVECHSPRGGVVAMRPLLIHSSSKARSTDPRRVLHIEYATSLSLAPGIQLAVA